MKLRARSAEIWKRRPAPGLPGSPYVQPLLPRLHHNSAALIAAMLNGRKLRLREVRTPAWGPHGEKVAEPSISAGSLCL